MARSAADVIGDEVKRLEATVARLRTQAAEAERRLRRLRAAERVLAGADPPPPLRDRGGSHRRGGAGLATRAARHAQVARLLAGRGRLGTSAIATAIGYAAPSVATLLRRQPDPPYFRRVKAGRYPVWELTAAGQKLARGD